MTTLTAAKAKKTTAPQSPLPGGYAGKLLRVDMTSGKCWAEPWGADQMRELIGGVGLGAMILYKETAKGKKNASWDDPENRLILGDPRACIEEISRFQRESSASHLVCRLSVPGIPRELCLRSLDLFTREVMPAIRRISLH